MNIYTVAFFGHRDFYEHNRCEETLTDIILELLKTKEYIEFIVGRNGEFDIFAAASVKQAQKIAGTHNSSLILILPYHMKDEQYYEKYYDDIEICNESASAYFKSAIEIRNKKMVDRANLIISYINKSEGGANNAVEYAKKSDKKIINLAVKN